MAVDPDRIAKAEATSRAGNERMHAWSERHDGAADGRHMCLCECGNPECDGRLWLTTAEYEALRADDTRFAVLVGHVFPEVERVLSEHDGRYLIVEKDADVRAIVEREYGSRKS